ncbi:unnamed protein product [Closterium sp. Yama58-4]|nr:unnamed protein product [Closterium sp. Yama58-4]
MTLFALINNVGASRGTPRTPFFEGCSPSPLLPSVATADVVDLLGAEKVGVASASSGRRRSGKGKGSKGGGGCGDGGGGGGSGGGGGGGGSGGGGGGGVGVGGGGGSGGGSGGGVGGGSGSGVGGGGRSGAAQRGSSGGSQAQQQQRQRLPRTPQDLREWYAQRQSPGGGGTCPYVIRTGERAGQTCGRLHTQHRCFSRLSDAWRAQFPDCSEMHNWAELLRRGVEIFDLDYDAILTAMYALTVSAEGDCYLCVPPDPGIEAAAPGACESVALGACESAALGASESALSGTAPAEALYTFTLDSGASRCFFRDSTTVTPLSAPDEWVDTFTPGGRRVAICTCARTGRHLATFTRRPGSSLYTLTVGSPQVAATGQVSLSGPESAPCLCRRLSHQTLLWHHRLGHPSLPRLRGMHSRLLVSGLPQSLPSLPRSPAPPCLPCVEGQQRAAPHSSSFPPTTAPLQTLHMDVWGPAHVRGQGHERYFLLVVDRYSRYTTVFPLRSKGEVPAVLIPWIRAVRLQLRDRFQTDFPVLRLHSDRGGEFSSDLLRGFCQGEGILQSFTLPASPQQNGVAERHIGLVMEIARTSMIHAAAPHFLWSLRSGTLRISSTSGPLSARAIPCVFLGFPTDAPGWQFYHPTSRRVLSSQDVTFDESVPFYRLFPYCTATLPPPPPLFLAPGPPPVDPLPPQGPAPSGVSQVDPLPLVEPVEVTGDSGAARGGTARGPKSGGAEPAGAGPEGAEPASAEPGGAEPERVEPGGAEPEREEPGGAEPGGAEPERVEPGGAEPGSAGPECVEPGGAVPERVEPGGAEPEH